MFQWLALFLILAAPAHADPISGAFFGAIQGIGGWYMGLTAAAQAGLQLAASAALTAASMAFQTKPRAQSIKRSMARPDSLPAKRTIYGRYRTYGSPAPFAVEGGRLFVCLILNSRPSAGGDIRIAIDKRDLELSGNLLDFNGPGAIVTNGAIAGYVNAWIGLGDQTAPPKAITDEVPGLFETSDAWRGRTVLWMKLRAGGKVNRLKRWPKVPPEIEVEMDFSMLWDPRDPAQDPDDPTTWTFTDNQVLAVLDALRTNPIAPYRLDQLDIESFEDAADVADQPVALKNGGTEPRYRAAGIIDWSAGELEQAIEPLILAGAGGVTRVGGKLAAIPGAWVPPEVTITDILDDDEMTVEVLQPGDDVFSGVRTTYVDPARDWQSADAGTYRVPGAQAADGGIEKIKTVDLSMCTSATQAQRVGKALALQGRMQRQISGTFPSAAFKAVSGANATLALPAPYNVFNGAYEALSINPGMDPVGESGVALRCPAVLRETGPEVWAWNPATDEQDVLEVVQFDGSRLDLPMPGVITAVSGSAAALGSGSSAQPRIMFSFDPANSDRIEAYEVEYRQSGGSWQDGGKIDADIRNGSGKVFGYIHPVQVGQSYDIRVRSKAPGNDVSEWRQVLGTTALPPSVTLTAPTMVSAVGGTGRVTVTIMTPNSDDVRGVEVWVSPNSNVANAAILPPTIWVNANRTFEVAETGLTAGQTRHYWAKTVGPYGAVSAFSTRVFATAT